MKLPVLKHDGIYADDENGMIVCQCDTRHQAAEIVLRCNAYPELVAALREFKSAHTSVCPSYEEGQDAQTAWVERKVCAANMASAILAKLPDGGV